MKIYQSASDSEDRSGSSALTAAIFASGMAFVDGTVVNVATAALQTSFSTTAGGVQWVVEAYALTLSAFLLIGGIMGDLYGRKRIFIWGNALFGVSSLFCGVASTLSMLVIARAIQGLAAALLIPGSLALITSAYAPAKRARAIGIWSGVTAMMGAIGPFAGGWAIDHFSWRAAFLINLPMAGLAVFFAWRLHESREMAKPQSINWIGAISLAAALAMLTYSLMSAQEHVMVVLPAALASVALFFVFRRTETRARAPLLPAALLAAPVFVAVNIITFFLYAALWGTMYFLPIDLIEIHHYSASEAGAALAPMILTLFVLSPWAGGLLERYGVRRTLTAGCSIVAVGLAGISLPGRDGTYWSTFFIPLLVLGLGMSVCVSPLTTTVMSSAPADQLGVASGINNAVSRVAALLAVAMLGLILSISFRCHLDLAMHQLRPSEEVRMQVDRQKPMLASVQYADVAIQHAVTNSFVDAFRAVIICAVGLAIVSATCAWRMLKEETPSAQ
ncbi:EmrB/QacA subfamily drug resistance transporter [Paraburkholderia sp. GAS199]|uniref:MFS transporter n=1 Tax=Paraburkholderia sp. GAS199 TaxID=3035126 RepID=UPI003D25AA9D